MVTGIRLSIQSFKGTEAKIRWCFELIGPFVTSVNNGPNAKKTLDTLFPNKNGLNKPENNLTLLSL
jgi:hypothetical protein